MSYEDRLAAIERTLGIGTKPGPLDPIIPRVPTIGPRAFAPQVGNGETPQAFKMLGQRRRNGQRQPIHEAVGLRGPGNALAISPDPVQAYIDLLTILNNTLSNLVSVTADPGGGFTVMDYAVDTVLDIDDATETIWHYNFSASANITLTLPPAAVGKVFKVKVQSAWRIILQADGSEVIRNMSEDSAAGGTTSNAVAELGAICILRCFELGFWEISEGTRGTWTPDVP